MAASDHLSEGQFTQPMLPRMGGSLEKWGVNPLNRRYGRFRLNYSTEILRPSSNYPYQEHKITATANDKPVGHLRWDDGEISSIEVAPKHRRKGIASEMHDMARRLPTKGGISHSTVRTTMGDNWAKTTPGYFPIADPIGSVPDNYTKPKKRKK